MNETIIKTATLSAIDLGHKAADDGDLIQAQRWNSYAQALLDLAMFEKTGEACHFESIIEAGRLKAKKDAAGIRAVS